MATGDDRPAPDNKKMSKSFFNQPSSDAVFENLKRALKSDTDVKKLRIAIAADRKRGKVIVDLGMESSKFEMSKKLALKFIATLQKKVDELHSATKE